MCGCSSSHHARTIPSQGALEIRVPDMTCGHCATTITKEIEAALPGTEVFADPASKRVVVQGASDRVLVEGVVRRAGYTPALP